MPGGASVIAQKPHSTPEGEGLAVRQASKLVGRVCLSQVNKSDFAAEAKYDGQRGMAVVDGGEVTLWSRNRANISQTFPDLHAALATAGRRMVLDGEIVALDETGVRSFSRLQQRWPQNRRPTGELLHRVPVRFIVFDVLEVDGRYITRAVLGSTRTADGDRVSPPPVGILDGGFASASFPECAHSS